MNHSKDKDSSFVTKGQGRGRVDRGRGRGNRGQGRGQRRQGRGQREYGRGGVAWKNGRGGRGNCHNEGNHKGAYGEKIFENISPQHRETVGTTSGNNQNIYSDEYSITNGNYNAEPICGNMENNKSNHFNDGLEKETYVGAEVTYGGTVKKKGEEIDLILQFQKNMQLQENVLPDVDVDNKVALNEVRGVRENETIKMEDISIHLNHDQALQINNQVKSIVRRHRYSGFQGCLPISLNHENISKLRSYPHKVSWKADGRRYMMLIEGEQKVYLIGTNLKSIFHVPDLEFRQKYDLKMHLSNTLLDGELIIDVNSQNGVKVTRFLIFDVITVEGRHVASESFHKRHEIIETDIIHPRSKAISKGLLHSKMEPFRVQRKLFWNASSRNVKQLLSKQFLNQVGHETDGLIFQRDVGPYVSGRTDTALKFKPVALNSIDFELKIIKYKGGRYGELYVNNYKRPVVFGDIEITKEIENLHSKIIECRYTETGWLFLRQRADRTYPNSYDTAISIWETICNPIDEKFLLKYL